MYISQLELASLKHACSTRLKSIKHAKMSVSIKTPNPSEVHTSFVSVRRVKSMYENSSQIEFIEKNLLFSFFFFFFGFTAS
jgi:hypothetical protein